MADPGLLNALLQGLVTGSLIAAGALGLSLVYSIAEVPNFAHGDMITIGAYLVLVFNAPGEIPFLPDLGGLSLAVAAVVGVALAGGVGAAYELAVFRRFRRSGAGLITMVIVSLGLALLLRNAVLFLVGSKNIRYRAAGVSNTNFDVFVSGYGLTVETSQRRAGEVVTLGEWGYPWWLLVGVLVLASVAGLAVARWRSRGEGFETVYLVPPRVVGTATFGAVLLALASLLRLAPGPTAGALWATRIGLTIKAVTILVASALVMFVLNLVLKRTKLGKAMRATADNMDLAEVRGVDVDRVQLVVWVIAGLLTAIAGVLAGWFASNLNPNMGFSLLLPIFAAVILGGIRSPYGAVAGALVIGVTMDVSVYLLPPEYAVYRTAVAFVILVAVLLVRPEGLWGEV